MESKVPASTADVEGSALGRIGIQVKERTSGQRQQTLTEAVVLTWMAEGTSAFPSAVADLLLVLRREHVVDDDLVTELLERAASVRLDKADE